MLGCFWSPYALKNVIPQKTAQLLQKKENLNCDLLHAVSVFQYLGFVCYLFLCLEGFEAAAVVGEKEVEDFSGCLAYSRSEDETL